MQTWASDVAVRLRELGLEADAEVAPEREGKGWLLVLARSDNESDRSQATISLSLDEHCVEVAAELPPGGVRSARARLTDPLRALEISTALEALPEQFAIGLVGDEDPAPASRASTDQVRALLARAEREQRSLWLGWSISRDVAVAHAALLDEQLQDAAVALGSVVTMLLPAPDVSASSVSTPKRRDKRDRSRPDDESRGPERRVRKSDRLRQRDRDLEAEPDTRENDGPSAGPQRTQSANSLPHAGLRGRLRRAGRPAGGGSARASIEKGSRVRVLEGPFSGKVGAVQELDGKGGARVMLGLLAVRVDVRDLARCSEGRGRPLLSTSHRKRVPVRS